MILGRQPAVWIGVIVTIVLAVVSTLAGQGIISDATAGKVTDTAKALQQLLELLAPIIAGVLIRSQVTPVAAPKLPANSLLTTPDGAQAIVVPVKDTFLPPVALPEPVVPGPNAPGVPKP